jgi:small conductance mechanosensitive channel
MVGEPEIEVTKRVETLTHVVNTTTAAVIGIVAVITILPEFGVNAGPLIAGLGIVGIAVGFGAQNVVRDVLNGLEILTENQYARGDYVSIRSATGGSVSGVVEDINLRRTVLRDFDGNVHFISHGQIDFASNHTRGYSRAAFNLTVAKSTDVDHLYRVIGQVGTEMMKDPTWRTALRESPHAEGIASLSDGSMEVRVEGATEPGAQWRVGNELRRRLKLALESEGIASRDKG